MRSDKPLISVFDEDSVDVVKGEYLSCPYVDGRRDYFTITFVSI